MTSDPALDTLLLPLASGALDWPAPGGCLFLRARTGPALNAARPLLDVTLDDKYVAQSGRVYLTGTQALVRLAFIHQFNDSLLPKLICKIIKLHINAGSNGLSDTFFWRIGNVMCGLKVFNCTQIRNYNSFETPFFSKYICQ